MRRYRVCCKYVFQQYWDVRQRCYDVAFSSAAIDCPPDEDGVRPQLLNVDEAGDDDDEAPGIDGETDDEVIDDRLNEDDRSDAEAGGEAEMPIGICLPCKPDAKIVEAHNQTHFPWGNWCEICVM